MKNTLSLFRSFLGISAAALLMFGCAEMQMEGGSSGSSGYGGSSASSSDVASGTYGDSLEACMGRIPSNATDGQRMFATGTCQRDEDARQPIMAVPGN
jgi:hypothetical protein